MFRKEELLVDATQVPFAMMAAQLDAVEDSLAGGDSDLGEDDPADNEEEEEPASDEDELADPAEDDEE